MDDWGKFNETSLLEKEYFYSYLSMKDTSGADYTHAKRFSKNFEIKALSEYYDLFVQRNRLLLPDEFNFWKMRLEKYGLVPVHFHSTSRLV